MGFQYYLRVHFDFMFLTNDENFLRAVRYLKLSRVLCADKHCRLCWSQPAFRRVTVGQRGHPGLVSSFAGMVYMAGLVFAVGGFNGSLRVRTVDSYDPVKDQWTSVANMRDRRSTLGAAVLNGLLYAVGGFDGSTGNSSSPPALLELAW